ncbi:MAG: DUF484 family protein [Sutterellaceae bacterium]|nr:DUF484 family protein [Burkholderiaceae bacterium]MDW8430022.1 DUF484 family protein [Sutterellaceae bacterium]
MDAQDVARYLEAHPDFFATHPQLLDRLTVPHPHNGQAISLLERQALVLRERIRGLEAKLAELIRHGQENDAIFEKLTRWTRALLAQEDEAALPTTLVAELQAAFSVPHCALRLWSVRPQFSGLPWTQPVAADVVRLADSMTAPYCGSNVGFDVAAWMSDDPAAVKSLAMLPLRVGAQRQTFGMLVLGSPDKDRFQITMGTAFLQRIGELASAALARLRAQ